MSSVHSCINRIERRRFLFNRFYGIANTMMRAQRVTKPLNFTNEKRVLTPRFSQLCLYEVSAKKRLCAPKRRQFSARPLSIYTLYPFRLFAQSGLIGPSFIRSISFFNGSDKYPTISFSYQFNTPAAAILLETTCSSFYNNQLSAVSRTNF